MTHRILVMGLPGAGKTYLAQHIVDRLQLAGKTVAWINADDIRKKNNDWDFSREGRIRQSLRMRQLADEFHTDYVLCDFIAPFEEMRKNFNARWTIWVDTIPSSRFKDTDDIFVPPEKYDFRVTVQDAANQSELIVSSII